MLSKQSSLAKVTSAGVVLDHAETGSNTTPADVTAAPPGGPSPCKHCLVDPGFLLCVCGCVCRLPGMSEHGRS